MICQGCGRLTFYKKMCEECVQNERMFQELPANPTPDRQPDSNTSAGVVHALVRAVLSRA
jgi:hypothetical protein